MLYPLTCQKNYEYKFPRSLIAPHGNVVTLIVGVVLHMANFSPPSSFPLSSCVSSWPTNMHRTLLAASHALVFCRSSLPTLSLLHKRETNFLYYLGYRRVGIFCYENLAYSLIYVRDTWFRVHVTPVHVGLAAIYSLMRTLNYRIFDWVWRTAKLTPDWDQEIFIFMLLSF